MLEGVGLTEKGENELSRPDKYVVYKWDPLRKVTNIYVREEVVAYMLLYV